MECVIDGSHNFVYFAFEIASEEILFLLCHAHTEKEAGIESLFT